jgi:hypothetical protein
MRNVTVGLVVLLAAGAVNAQQAPKLVCRDLAKTGNFVGSDETYVNGMACKYADDAPVARMQSRNPLNRKRLSISTAPIASRARLRTRNSTWMA